MALGHPPQRVVVGRLQLTQHCAEPLQPAALALGLEALPRLLVCGAGVVPIATRLVRGPGARGESVAVGGSSGW